MKIEKLGKPVANLYDEKEYVVHIKNLKQAQISFEKKHGVIGFNQKAWPKPYIDMNTELRKMQKMILKNIFLKQ